MRHGYGAEMDSTKLLAVFLGDSADCEGEVGRDGLCLCLCLSSCDGICIAGGRLVPYCERFGQEDSSGVVDHVQGICGRKMIWLVDPQRWGEIVEPGFQVQKTGFEKCGSLILVVDGGL